MKSLTLNSLLILCPLILYSCKESTIVVADCILPSERESQNLDSPEDDQKSLCLLPTREPNANLTATLTLQDFSVQDEIKMEKAIERLKIVINSVAFKNRVLNHTYNGQKTFVDNEGLTNQEIYDKVMLGSEVLIPGNDEEMDLDITLYYANNSVVGYTYPDTTRVWTNDKFFSTYTYAQVAQNVVHEWIHKLGFGHDYNRTTKRNYSVPYAIGTIIKDLIEEMTPQVNQEVAQNNK